MSVVWLQNGHVVVQSLSCVRLCGTPWTAVHQASLSFIISRSLLNFVSIESVTPSNHLILCRPLLLPLIFPSVRVFSNEWVLQIRWFSFRISPSNEYSGLISFRIDQFDLLTVQGTLTISPSMSFASWLGLGGVCVYLSLYFYWGWEFFKIFFNLGVIFKLFIFS